MSESTESPRATPAEPKEPETLLSRFQKLVQDDWEGVAVVVGLVVLAVAALLAPDPTNATVRFWVAATCPVLILLTVVIIRMRLAVGQQGASTVKLVTRAQEILSQTNSVLDRLSAEPLLKQEREFPQAFLANATNLDLLGITLGRSLGDNIDSIVDVLIKGGQVRILIVQVNPQLEAEFPTRFRDGRAGGQTLEARINGTMDSIEIIVERAKERGAHGSLSVGRLPFFTPCGLIVVRKNGGCDMRCEIYHRSSTGDQTAFYLNTGGGTTTDAILKDFEHTFDSYWRVSQHAKVFPDLPPTAIVELDSHV